MIHDLKIWPQFFEAIVEKDLIKRKTCEIRKSDRDYRVGDVLNLKEWIPDNQEYTGREAKRFVTHIVSGEPFLPVGIVVMSLIEV